MNAQFKIQDLTLCFPLFSDGLDMNLNSIRTNVKNQSLEKSTMAFVNEYISEEDFEKYNIEELNKKYYIGNAKSKWTIDHEQDVYLRFCHSGREEFCNHLNFYMYWKGHLIDIYLIRKRTGEKFGEQSAHYDMKRIEIPDIIKNSESQIISDIKQALEEYKIHGILSKCTSFTATFAF